MCGHHHQRAQRATVDASDRVVTAMADERVTSAERDRVIEQLRLHVGSGRLSLEEFGDRVDEVLEAKTGRELSVVLRELPRLRTRGEVREERRATVLPYLLVSALLVAIWSVTGFGFPWPVFPLLGWGLPVLGQSTRLRREEQAATV